MYKSTNIAAKIKELSKAKNIVIKDMLTECGLSKNTLSSMLSGGSTPKSDNLARIADYLNVSVDYLLGRTNIPEVNKVNTIVIPIAARGGNGVEYKEMPVEEYLKLLKDYPELTAPQGDIIPLDQD